MNVNAANEDMLSESELKKLPQGGEGEKRREDRGRWTEIENVNKKNSVDALEMVKVLHWNIFAFINSKYCNPILNV